jgi:antitoxin (DNA-binding transcriptional repressor) of toxin-antitoxin stability system
MNAISLDEAQRHLSELVLKLSTEGDLVILNANIPVAKLSPIGPATALHSLSELQPSSVGALLRPYPASDDDILTEMLPSRS